MPATTLAVFADHGEATGNTITGRYHDARRVLDQLATAGIDFEDVTGLLEREGLAKFENNWNELTHTIAAELHRNQPARILTPARQRTRIPSSAGRVNEGEHHGLGGASEPGTYASWNWSWGNRKWGRNEEAITQHPARLVRKGDLR